MPIPDQAAPPQAAVRSLESPDDLDEARLEAIGFIFHGKVPSADGKGPAVRAGSNLLHFARCAKLDKAGDGETKIWFRTIAVAKEHLDGAVGSLRWKWCKVCEREITQKILNERETPVTTAEAVASSSSFISRR